MLRQNLLNIALKLIPGESFTYYRYKGETIDTMGRKIPSYEEGQVIYGSVQSLDNSLYQQLGLDLAKNYKIFYGADDIKGNAEQSQPDKFEYAGKTYEIVRNANWFNYDGWAGVLAVEIKKDRLQSGN